jgi:hypothetical protein
MRILMQVRIPLETFNAAVRDGTVGDWTRVRIAERAGGDTST